MITIKTIDDNIAELKIDEGTPHTIILLGIEMLIEALMEETSAKGVTIDNILEYLKRIYERDNGK